MYTTMLAFHNILRWLVLIGGVLAVGRAVYGWTQKKPWTALDNQFGLIFTVGMDVQILLGLILYVFLSPITQTAFRDFGAAMSDSDLRFWAVEHIAVMIIALVFAHVGRSRAKKAGEAIQKHKVAAIFFAIATLAVFLGMPWFRPLLPAGL